MTTYADGLYQYGGMPVGIGIMDVGNIYWVNNSPTSTKGIEMTKRFGATEYSDQTKMLHTTIASAISACKGGRNDYVICGTGAYTLTAAVTVAGKSSVHLIGQNGLGQGNGCVEATVLIQSGNYQAVIMETACELTGFGIINKTGYQAVTAAITSYGCNIHHNSFRIVGGAAIDLVSLLLNSNGSICDNRFYTYTGGVLNSVIYQGEGTGVNVCRNHITASAQAVYTYGIYCDAISGMVADNYISECGGTASGAYGGQITNAIKVPYHCCAINNRCAVATGQGLNGGTTNITFVDNRDGQAGGAAAITT
jgi:hypothetical protein